MKAADNETNLNSLEQIAAEQKDLRTKYEAMKRENERLSRAEERVRVMTKAMRVLRATTDVQWVHDCIDAAIRPAPEQPAQPSFCPDCKSATQSFRGYRADEHGEWDCENEWHGKPAQPSAEKATPLTVQAQDGSVLVEDPLRNLSVLALTTPLHITCPFDGQRWCFHTQEQAEMFQEHLKRHATESATLKAREAATIATVNAAWADTVAVLTAERDALKDAIA